MLDGPLGQVLADIMGAYGSSGDDGGGGVGVAFTDDECEAGGADAEGKPSAPKKHVIPFVPAAGPRLRNYSTFLGCKIITLE